MHYLVTMVGICYFNQSLIAFLQIGLKSLLTFFQQTGISDVKAELKGFLDVEYNWSPQRQLVSSLKLLCYKFLSINRLAL